LWLYTKLSHNYEFSLNTLDPRLRGEDNKSKCSVIPAQAGIQDTYGKLIVLAEFGIEPHFIMKNGPESFFGRLYPSSTLKGIKVY